MFIINFWIILFFLFCFTLAIFKLSVMLEEGQPLFKDLCLFFLPNVPKAMFIQEAMSIPDSRV